MRCLPLLILIPPATLAAAPRSLPDTMPLTRQDDLARWMVDSLNTYLEGRIAASVAERQTHWHRDFGSIEAYRRSVEPNRRRFLRSIGAIDQRVPARPPGGLEHSAGPPIARGPNYTVHPVRWPVLADVDGEGLLVLPTATPVARVIALPDADQAPEQLVGLAPGTPPEAQYARRLAEQGCLVVVPTLIDTAHTWSGNPRIRMTTQPHREWIYRQAYEVGHHIIGFEVEKVMAAVDRLTPGPAGQRRPIGLIGHREGGLIALDAAAADPRIAAVVVSDYFGPREAVWREPIYHNVWRLLAEFGDAELAGLIVPRQLIVETHPPPPSRPSPAGPSWTAPPPATVRRELDRARALSRPLGATGSLSLVESSRPGSPAALTALLTALGAGGSLRASGPPPQPTGAPRPDPTARLHRQFDQLVACCQRLVGESPRRRAEFWKDADRSSVDRWVRTTAAYREKFWDLILGRFPRPQGPVNPRTRLIFDEPRFVAYEVVLDLYPTVPCSGILCVPRDLKPGERRPVVVCQHGLEGRPRDVVDPRAQNPYYFSFAAQLADRGFVTYAPQNPYIFMDDFRMIQRKANPLGGALMGLIARQHGRTIDWLSSLPFVDPRRIGFYGLSYGGKTAMRVPAVETRYALSICSGDFNEWVLKNTRVDSKYSYMFSGEWEMFEFDLANTFNYAEMAGLIAPRPFMVERGHFDSVAPDPWVALEFAKVAKLYADLGIPDRATIEFFPGPHRIWGQGTFRFLEQQLHWPPKSEAAAPRSPR